MRTRMSSPVLLLIGLALGLLAMWAAASPVGATGDLVTGGWEACSIDGGSTWFACPSLWHCNNPCKTGKCSIDYSVSCSSIDYGSCSGGSVTLISCDSSGPGTISDSGMVACYCTDPGGDFQVVSGTCY